MLLIGGGGGGGGGNGWEKADGGGAFVVRCSRRFMSMVMIHEMHDNNVMIMHALLLRVLMYELLW